MSPMKLSAGLFVQHADEDLLVLDLHLVGAGLHSVLLCIHQAGNSHKLKCRGMETNQDETQNASWNVVSTEIIEYKQNGTI